MMRGRVAPREALELARRHQSGSQTTPPFAPPNGTLTTAHFQVIHAASAVTSSSVTPGRSGCRPLPGPARCCAPRDSPVNTSISPLSITNRNRDGELPLGLSEYPVDAGIQLELGCSPIEPGRHRVEWILLVRNGVRGGEFSRATVHERVRRHHSLQRDGKVNRVSEERDSRRECAEVPGGGSRVSHPGRCTPHRRLARVA